MSNVFTLKDAVQTVLSGFNGTFTIKPGYDEYYIMTNYCDKYIGCVSDYSVSLFTAGIRRNSDGSFTRYDDRNDFTFNYTVAEVNYQSCVNDLCTDFKRLLEKYLKDIGHETTYSNNNVDFNANVLRDVRYKQKQELIDEIIREAEEAVFI